MLYSGASCSHREGGVDPARRVLQFMFAILARPQENVDSTGSITTSWGIWFPSDAYHTVNFQVQIDGVGKPDGSVSQDTTEDEDSPFMIVELKRPNKWKDLGRREVWTQLDGSFNYRHFYKGIITVFEDDHPELPWVKRTLKWWNCQIQGLDRYLASSARSP